MKLALIALAAGAHAAGIKNTFHARDYSDFTQCPSNSPVSCSGSGSASCCFESPGGVLLQTQFWDYNPATGPSDSFTLHGLWPDNCSGGYDSNCDSSLDVDASNIQNIIVNEFGDQNLYDTMSTYWKNYNGDDSELWEHEFNKHGTCINTNTPACYGSTYQQDINIYNFYKIAVGLYQQLPTYQFLTNAGITPSESATYTYDQIASALSSNFGGHQVYFKCDNNDALSEVWYFHHLQGPLINQNFVQIDTLAKSNCPSSGISFMPKSS